MGHDLPRLLVTLAREPWAFAWTPPIPSLCHRVTALNLCRGADDLDHRTCCQVVRCGCEPGAVPRRLSGGSAKATLRLSPHVLCVFVHTRVTCLVRVRACAGLHECVSGRKTRQFWNGQAFRGLFRFLGLSGLWLVDLKIDREVCTPSGPGPPVCSTGPFPEQPWEVDAIGLIGQRRE